MEPLLVTPPELQPVLLELTHLEPLFHAAAPDATPHHFEALVYTLHRPGRDTRRATVWRRAGARWQAVFHQGTVVQEPY